MTGEQLTGKDRRTSERLSDDSTLLVSGYTEQGAPFAVITCINDISLDGISFFLDIPVCKEAIVQLALCSKKIDGLIFGIRATALRIFEAGSQLGRYLIGAQFLGEFVQIGSNPRVEDIARELEEAVKYDERIRLGVRGTTGKCCEICGKAFVVPPEILQVSNPICCFNCHLQRHSEIRAGEQSGLKFEVPAEEPVTEKLS